MAPISPLDPLLESYTYSRTHMRSTLTLVDPSYATVNINKWVFHRRTYVPENYTLYFDISYKIKMNNYNSNLAQLLLEINLIELCI